MSGMFVVTNHRQDLHTTETTGNERFPIVLFLWFLWCEDLACDWLQHNKHSRHILGVHANIITAVIRSYIQLMLSGNKQIFNSVNVRL